MTVSEIPKLEGEVFAAQLGEGEVAVFVFSAGEKYLEYRFEPLTKTLTLSADGEISHAQGPPDYHWEVATEGFASCAAYSYSTSEGPDATLKVNGMSTEMIRVDNAEPSKAIPVVQGAGSCIYACAIQGCCACCYCVHRSIGVPECLDTLCCRWAGITCR